jgi:hypothetical protein
MRFTLSQVKPNDLLKVRNETGRAVDAVVTSVELSADKLNHFAYREVVSGVTDTAFLCQITEHPLKPTRGHDGA